MGWQAVGLAATIFIRSYNNFGVPAADLAAAREEAQAVLQEPGDLPRAVIHFVKDKAHRR